jgi:hypothetical protein
MIFHHRSERELFEKMALFRVPADGSRKLEINIFLQYLDGGMSSQEEDTRESW